MSEEAYQLLVRVELFGRGETGDETVLLGRDMALINGNMSLLGTGGPKSTGILAEEMAWAVVNGAVEAERREALRQVLEGADVDDEGVAGAD